MISDEQFTQQAMDMSPGLYRLSISMLRHEADCRDAVQQALLRAWAARSRIDPGRFRAYLTRIVINECHNIQRQRMRVSPMADLPEPEPIWQPEESELAAAIEGLPPALRLPLLLRYMENYTEKETAQALGISLPAVKNRLFRARRALKKTLTDWEVAPE